MPRVTCAFCGLPFSVRRAPEGAVFYCCSGCALASRIAVHDGQLPVSRGLVVALALGFGLFNQILFAVLGVAVTAEGRAEVGGRLTLVSLAIGAVLFLACIGFVVTARSRHWTDAAAILPAVVAIVVGAFALAAGAGDRASWWALGANAWLAVWLSRGWMRRARRRE